MRRIFILLSVIVMVAISFVGCGNKDGQTFGEFLNERYPYIEYYNSWFRFDGDNRKIEIIDGYSLNQGNSYEWIKTDSGYDLIIHFAKDGE